MKKITDTIFIIIMAGIMLAIFNHYASGWDKFFGFRSAFLPIFSVVGIIVAAGIVGSWWLRNRQKEVQNNCPSCGAEIKTAFSREDKLIGGKNLYCPQCNTLMWLSVLKKEKPHFFSRV